MADEVGSGTGASVGGCPESTCILVGGGDGVGECGKSFQAAMATTAPRAAPTRYLADAVPAGGEASGASSAELIDTGAEPEVSSSLFEQGVNS